MSLFLLLLVPVIVGLGGKIIWKNEITWREFLLQEGIVVVFIFSTFFISAWGKTQDTEIWSGSIAGKERKTVSCQESYPCHCHEVCSGSGQNRSCSTQCDTCWRYWTITNWSAVTTNGETAYDEGTCHNDKPREPARYTAIVIGEPTAIEHSYTNYIKGNPDTIIRRVNVNKNFNIPAYPEVFDYYRVSRFINVDINTSTFAAYDNDLDELNAELGSLKQVNIIVIVTAEQDQMYVEKLREKWLGGKKNDFVVVVGAPHFPAIQWAQVMSWSDSEDAKVFTKNRIMELGRFDERKIVEIIKQEVGGKYTRKEMSDFDYLKARIEPSGLAKWIIWVVGVLGSVALSVWFKQEEVL